MKPEHTTATRRSFMENGWDRGWIKHTWPRLPSLQGIKWITRSFLPRFPLRGAFAPDDLRAGLL